MNLQDKLPALEMISISGTKEVELSNNLQTMINEWKDIKFPISKFKDTNLNILSNLDDIQVGFGSGKYFPFQ